MSLDDFTPPPLPFQLELSGGVVGLLGTAGEPFACNSEPLLAEKIGIEGGLGVFGWKPLDREEDDSAARPVEEEAESEEAYEDGNGGDVLLGSLPPATADMFGMLGWPDDDLLELSEEEVLACW